ncbi:hypothetical protein NUSPORA_01873 [Nucleospora cyclopteri]
MSTLMAFLEEQKKKKITVFTSAGDIYEGELDDFDIYANISLANCTVNSEKERKFCAINGLIVTHIKMAEIN